MDGLISSVTEYFYTDKNSEVSLSAKKIDDTAILRELADTILHIARKLHTHTSHNPLVVSLSNLESLLLMKIERQPGMSPSELSQLLALRSSNTAAALRGLAEKGMVVRKPDPQDKRVSRLYITPTAADSIMTVHRGWAELLKQANISDEKLKETVNVLMMLDSSLSE